MGSTARTRRIGAPFQTRLELSDTPIELMETLYPFRYLRYELNEDAEGAGRHRGGYGITQAIQLLAPK